MNKDNLENKPTMEFSAGQDISKSKKFTHRIQYLDSIVGQAIHQFFLDTGVKIKFIEVLPNENGTFILNFKYGFETQISVHGGTRLEGEGYPI